MTFLIHTPYQPGDSILHRTDARVKVGLSLTCILAIALTPVQAWPIWLLLLSVALVLIILGELKATVLIKRSMIAVPFMVTALPLLFTVKGAAIFTLPWGWQASWEGALQLINVVIKVWLSLLVSIALTATTTFDDIVRILQHWGLPKLLVSIISMTWRYIFLLAEEAQRLLRARASRSGKSDSGHQRGTNNVAWRARVTGNMAGNLMLRGTERSERVYAAMLARGYDGKPHGDTLTALRPSERITLTMGISLLVFIVLLGQVFWG